MTIVAMLIALAAQAAQGPLDGAWRQVDDGSGLIIAIDDAATARAGDRVRVRLRVERIAAAAGMRWGVAVIEFDCRAQRSRVLASHEYDSNRVLLRARDEAELASTALPPPRGRELETLIAACRRTGWGEAGAAQ